VYASEIIVLASIFLGCATAGLPSSIWSNQADKLEKPNFIIPPMSADVTPMNTDEIFLCPDI